MVGQIVKEFLLSSTGYLQGSHEAGCFGDLSSAVSALGNLDFGKWRIQVAHPGLW